MARAQGGKKRAKRGKTVPASLAKAGAGREAMVWVTCASAAEAEKIARALLKERLAACCNIVARVRSLYWWQGSIQEDTEALLVCKTSQPKARAAAARIRALHSYRVPVVEKLAAPHLLEASRAWLRESLCKPRAHPAPKKSKAL